MIEISRLRRDFASEGCVVQAVRDVTLTIPQGKLFTLLGPSGCGKSTTLRCVAGLERPDGGEIKIGGRTLFSSEKGIFVPAHKRGVGMVFQSYAIWPHMKVFDNVAYPLRIKKIPKREVTDRVMKVLNTVGLDGLENRLAPQLSGGQQQRVALARALVTEPGVLLLDEPLSNLDAKLREQMRVEIRELQQRLQITTLYVTHDQTEALAISDFIAVMNRGELLDVGPPREVYVRPRSEFAADFVGLTSMVKGKVVGRKGNLGVVDTNLGELTCPIPEDCSASEDVSIFIRPENIRVWTNRPECENNLFVGRIASVIFLGELVDCCIRIGTELIRARLHSSTSISEDDDVYVQIAPESLISIHPKHPHNPLAALNSRREMSGTSAPSAGKT